LFKADQGIYHFTNLHLGYVVLQSLSQLISKDPAPLSGNLGSPAQVILSPVDPEELPESLPDEEPPEGVVVVTEAPPEHPEQE